ncbi:MAG: peptide chain release factor N(5)-glutamine methyltransferase [Planctomycetes bacterium]|nr:peptide chain release factor N(5)-glutamine methyltransferase [Planctomycetota bacterium]
MKTQSAGRTRPWTSLDLVKTAAEFLAKKGVENARLEAEVLLAHVLNCDRVFLYTHFDRPLVPTEVDEYRDLIRRRAERIPTKYLTGRCEFFSLDLEVDPSVLIPRPETEFLVNAAIEAVAGNPEPILVDLGTGSGNIAIVLAKTIPDAGIYASDISEDALEVARRNAERHEVADRITFLCGDLFAPFDNVPLVDVIVSNPPYVADGEHDGLQPEIRLYEPDIALRAGEDGLAFFRRIACEGRSHLKAGGLMILEIGQGQGDAVEGILNENAIEVRKVIPDYSKIERVVVATYQPQKTGAE